MHFGAYFPLIRTYEVILSVKRQHFLTRYFLLDECLKHLFFGNDLKNKSASQGILNIRCRQPRNFKAIFQFYYFLSQNSIF